MKGLLGLAACMMPLIAAAEFVVPIESVEEYVNVRMIPDSKSEVVGRLYQGDSARVIKSTAEWHEIEIAGGATGYISTEWTLLVDAIPVAEVGTDQPDAKSTVSDAIATSEKKDIAELTPEEALWALDNIEPVTFSFAENDPERHIGFLAENAPELVASSESEGLKPLEIVAVLMKVVKLQQHQIEELQSQLAKRN
ncbi:MAG: SH3 domain-containing protein [Woeseiaceae bacterium]|nr:SH3 domain-containing protein [Woeseiaceae bacterium]